MRSDRLVLAGGGEVGRGRLVLPGLPGRAVPPGLPSPGDRVEEGGVLRITPLRGSFLDVRYGELLLGRMNLLLPDGSDVRLNGLPVRREELPRGQAALARWDPSTGRVGRLEVIDPSRERGEPPGPGDLWAVRAGLAPGAVAPSRPLRAGEVLHLEVKASAGGEVTVDLAGYAWGLPCPEVAPGTYRGRWRALPGVDLPDTFVIGRLRRAGLDYPPRVGPRVWFAPSPPAVTQRGPEGPASPDSPVFAVYESPGARVDASRVRLRLDGGDVTARARRTLSTVYYAPAGGLSPGRHRVELVVPDTAGNRTLVRWAFEVSAGPVSSRSAPGWPGDGGRCRSATGTGP